MVEMTVAEGVQTGAV